MRLPGDASSSVFKPLSAIAFNKDEKATTKQSLEVLLDSTPKPNL